MLVFLFSYSVSSCADTELLLCQRSNSVLASTFRSFSHNKIFKILRKRVQIRNSHKTLSAKYVPYNILWNNFKNLKFLAINVLNSNFNFELIVNVWAEMMYYVSHIGNMPLSCVKLKIHSFIIIWFSMKSGDFRDFCYGVVKIGLHTQGQNDILTQNNVTQDKNTWTCSKFWTTLVKLFHALCLRILNFVLLNSQESDKIKNDCLLDKIGRK